MSDRLTLLISCVWSRSDTHDPRYQILALLPNPIFVLPKELNTLFFSVFSEALVQPMVKGIVQVEVRKRAKTQKRLVFGSFGSYDSMAVWAPTRSAQGVTLATGRSGTKTGQIGQNRDEMGKNWDDLLQNWDEVGRSTSQLLSRIKPSQGRENPLFPRFLRFVSRPFSGIRLPTRGEIRRRGRAKPHRRPKSVWYAITRTQGALVGPPGHHVNHGRRCSDRGPPKGGTTSAVAPPGFLQVGPRK